MNDSSKHDPSEQQAREGTLHEAAEQLGEMGSWEWIAESGQVIWSDNHFRLFGLKPNEVEPTPEFVLEQTHPEDREQVSREVERRLNAGGKAKPLEYRIVRRDGEVRHLRSTITAVETEPRRVLGYVQDVTERRHAEREIQAHIAVADALGTWESLERSGVRLLNALGRAMEFVAGAIWLPRADLLVPQVFWHESSLIGGSELEHAVRGRRIPRGFGLPGQVWVSMQPASVANVIDDPSFEFHGPAAKTGLRGAVAFPAMTGEEVLAVLNFYSQEELAPTDRLISSLIGIGRELGHFLDRRRGEFGPPPLTPRQLEVLQLAARGHSAPDIAKELDVSRDTVKTHLRHIDSTLGVNDRAAAVAEGMRMGLIE